MKRIFSIVNLADLEGNFDHLIKILNGPTRANLRPPVILISPERAQCPNLNVLYYFWLVGMYVPHRS